MLNSMLLLVTQAVSEPATFLGVSLLDEDIYKLIFRFSLNFIVLTIVIRYVYFAKTPRRNYLFTFYMISIISFVIHVSEFFRLEAHALITFSKTSSLVTLNLFCFNFCFNRLDICRSDGLITQRWEGLHHRIGDLSENQGNIPFL